jgi:hypothetical protein
MALVLTEKLAALELAVSAVDKARSTLEKARAATDAAQAKYDEAIKAAHDLQADVQASIAAILPPAASSPRIRVA